MSFENLLDNIPMNIVIYRYEDNDFTIVYFNKKARATESVYLEDIKGKKLTEVFPAVKEFGLYDVLLDVQKSGTIKEHDINFYQDDRISGWRRNIVERLEDGNLLVSYTDESENVSREQALKSFSTIVDESINEVYIFDADTLKFSYINKAAEKNIGYSKEEMFSLAPYDIKPHYNKKQFLDLLEPFKKGEVEHLSFETLHQRKDGTLYNVEIRLHKMSLDIGGVYIVFAQDISKRKNEEKKLFESEKKFRSIVESSLVAVMLYNEKIEYVNNVFINIVGYTEVELLDMYPWQLVDPRFQDDAKNLVEKRFDEKAEIVDYKTIKLISKAGNERYLKTSSTLVQYNGKKVVLLTMVDVTEEVNTKKQVKLLSRAVEQTDALVSIVDTDGIMSYVNEALAVHTGYKKSELIGEHTRIFKSGKTQSKLYPKLWDTLLSGNVYKDVVINKKKDKQLFYEEMTITPMYNERNQLTHFIVTGQDVTTRMELEKRLQTLATKDTLTGIYNRFKINEEIDIAIANYERKHIALGLLMLDVDHFKSINDKFGHDVGDYALQEITSLISNAIRVGDHFGRWGGEEFMLLITAESKEGIMQLAEKLRSRVAEHIFEDIGHITISIGVSIFGVGDTKESLIKRADKALYSSKEKGRNCVSFD